MAETIKNFVSTPKGDIIEVRYKNGKAKMQLRWAKSFRPTMERNFQEAQRFVDSECIRQMKPYTPMQSGALEKSATLGTKIGSGEIHQVAPHARYQYHGRLMVSRITGSAFASAGESKVLTSQLLKYSTIRHPQAGKLWFERMKADKKERILRGAQKYAGGEG